MSKQIIDRLNTKAERDEARMLYIAALTKYIDIFEEKEEVEFCGWQNNLWGGIATFENHSIDFLDIVYSIDNELPIGMIFEWHEYNTANHFKKRSLVNLKNYHKGFRHE